jgi:hypothetical protein
MRTIMSFKSTHGGDGGHGGIAVNAGNINFGGDQTNTASANGGDGGHAVGFHY